MKKRTDLTGSTDRARYFGEFLLHGLEVVHRPDKGSILLARVRGGLLILRGWEETYHRAEDREQQIFNRDKKRKKKFGLVEHPPGGGGHREYLQNIQNLALFTCIYTRRGRQRVWAEPESQVRGTKGPGCILRAFPV